MTREKNGTLCAECCSYLSLREIDVVYGIYSEVIPIYATNGSVFCWVCYQCRLVLVNISTESIFTAPYLF